MTDQLRVIGICGPKFSGKDTAAKGLLNQNQAYSRLLFRRAPMAEGVKNICAEMFGYSYELMEDPVLKEQETESWPHIAPRWPMMDIANWLRDKYGGDVHARRWERVAREFPEYGAHIITDVRFPEEVAMLRRLGGILIYVKREKAELELASKQKAGDSMALNPSESHYSRLLSEADAVVSNDETIARLHGQIQAVVRQKFDHWKFWKADLDPIYALRTGGATL